MKIFDQRTPEGGVSMVAYDIPVGTVFYGNIANRNRGPFLRHHGGVVDLSHPEATWSLSGLVVHTYEPVEATLTVTGTLRRF